MAVSLIEKNYSTNYCKFSYDNWSNDKDFIPTMNTRGRGILSTILSCSQGSMAIGTDGTMKILNGDSNKWVDYNVGSSSGSSGGNSGNGNSGTIDEIDIATDQEVENMLDDVIENN